MFHLQQTTEKHEAFKNDLVAMLRKHAGDLSAPEMLALISYLVGQVIALQDGNTMTREQALELVSKNIEQGNKDAAEEHLMRAPKGSA
jgi:hypothetical protein